MKKKSNFRLDPKTGLFLFLESQSEESDSELEDEVYKLPTPKNSGIGSPGMKKKKHSRLPNMAQQDPRRLNTKFNATQVPKKKQGKIESVVYV